MTAPTFARTRSRSRRARRDPLSVVTVDPQDAQAAIDAGDPLVVDVDGSGSGWNLYEVLPSSYRVYRNEREMTVGHAEVQIRS